jgi:hypothetical protein
MFTKEMINPEPFLKIGNVLQHFPCALLIKEDTE